MDELDALEMNALAVMHREGGGNPLGQGEILPATAICGPYGVSIGTDPVGSKVSEEYRFTNTRLACMNAFPLNSAKAEVCARETHKLENEILAGRLDPKNVPCNTKIGLDVGADWLKDPKVIGLIGMGALSLILVLVIARR